MERHAPVPSRWSAGPAQGAPLLLLLFALLALASIAQGLGEFTVPLLLGEEPFALTRSLAAIAGAPGLFAAILVHNLGLALLVPGCGLLAACRERDARNRRLLAPILIVALVGAIATGIVTVVATSPPHRLPFLLPLAAGEAAAVLLVALFTHWQMRAHDTGTMGWPQARAALRALWPVLAPVTVVLVALAALETHFLLG